MMGRSNEHERICGTCLMSISTGVHSGSSYRGVSRFKAYMTGARYFRNRNVSSQCAAVRMFEAGIYPGDI
jgi:hypothetical protein